MTNKHKYLIVIAGPTAVGKTDVAISVAKHFNTEIISADARQFYRELNIGTAKPSSAQLAEVKHYFINNLSIHDPYDVGLYEQEVLQVLSPLFLLHDTIILCGGSGLYIDAVINGLDKFPEKDIEIRKQLEHKLKSEGIESLQQLLKEKDIKYYNKVDLQNPHRLIRALEVYLTTGIPYSSYTKKEPDKRGFTAIKICLNIERPVLYQRINERVDKMMQSGLVEEAEKLYQYKNIPALNTVGYKELFEYFDGEKDLKTALEEIKQHTRNYAKRQLTWFRKDQDYKIFRPEQLDEMVAFVKQEIK
ncbi:MAG: tRNA (adenosine(37)-N6)-dimethylallyltransferase MiaA [Fimbriimonadaceae bacterium]|nr:tRNA (adenosine(37)-N6)-dimethylallyltransferase MiaA [Chitinophagales bacterium]